MVSRTAAKFRSNCHHGSGDIMALVCHMILQDHVIQGSCDFMGGTLSWYVTPLPSLVVTGIVLVEICFKFVK